MGLFIGLIRLSTAARMIGRLNRRSPFHRGTPTLRSDDTEAR
jgi:hypothetical protein